MKFFVSNGLAIGGTLFLHTKYHKISCVSPDHRTQDQIDHFAISGGWKRSLLDTEIKEG